jgi:signal transduction histidine kinase/ABC-type amino acid transport substrate-binding protein
MFRLVFFAAAFLICLPLYARDKYVAVFPENVPPYYITINGETNGFGIELVKELAKRLDIDVEFRPMRTREEVVKAIMQGEADIIPNTIKTDKRSPFLLYTESYNTSPVGVMTRTDKYDINSLEDLANHKLAYQSNNIYLNKLEHIDNITLLPTENGEHLLYDLFSGKVDAILYHIPPTLETAKAMGIGNKIKIIHPILYESVRSIAVSKRLPDLYQKLDSELTNYMKTTEYINLYKKWHAEDEVYWDKRKTYTTFIAIFIITMSGMILWRFISLKKKNKELKNAKEALEKSEESFRALAGVSNDIMIFCSPDYKEVFFISDSYSRVCGRNIDSFKEDPLSLRRCVHPADRELLEPNNIFLKESELNKNIRLINNKTEEVHWVIIRKYLFTGEKSKEAMLAVVMTEISDVVKAQEERAAHEAVMVQQAKYASMGEMIRAISHQWKQPLNALYLCTQLMHDEAEERKDNTMLEYLNSSEELIEHMASTISDFRSFFKSDHTSEDFDATATVINTIKLIEPQIRSLGIKYSITCSCHNRQYDCSNKIVNKDHPCKFYVKGKRNEFKHAVINILQNAKDELIRKPSDDKNITVTMHCNGGFMLDISDDGKGIAEGMLEKIFNPDITMKEDGTGLGLHLTKKIIESMHGRVWAENYNDGARFRIKLPLYNKQDTFN